MSGGSDSRLTRSFARLLDFLVLHVEVLEVALSIFEKQTIEYLFPSFSATRRISVVLDTGAMGRTLARGGTR